MTSGTLRKGGQKQLLLLFLCKIGNDAIWVSFMKMFDKSNNAHIQYYIDLTQLCVSLSCVATFCST